jgi:hypothetical protein
VAKQLLLPLVHVEAGMRSYDRTAPEEINRLAVDHISDLCLTTDDAAARRLRAEGVAEDAIVVCGDVMYDLFLQVQPGAPRRWFARTSPRVSAEPFVLLTLHRSENVDDPQRLARDPRRLRNGARARHLSGASAHGGAPARIRAGALPAGVVVCEPLGLRRDGRARIARADDLHRLGRRAA